MIPEFDKLPPAIRQWLNDFGDPDFWTDQLVWNIYHSVARYGEAAVLAELRSIQIDRAIAKGTPTNGNIA